MLLLLLLLSATGTFFTALIEFGLKEFHPCSSSNYSAQQSARDKTCRYKSTAAAQGITLPVKCDEHVMRYVWYHCNCPTNTGNHIRHCRVLRAKYF